MSRIRTIKPELYDTVLRYAHLAGEHLHSAAGNIATISLRCKKLRS